MLMWELTADNPVPHCIFTPLSCSYAPRSHPITQACFCNAHIQHLLLPPPWPEYLLNPIKPLFLQTSGRSQSRIVLCIPISPVSGLLRCALVHGFPWSHINNANTLNSS